MSSLSIFLLLLIFFSPTRLFVSCHLFCQVHDNDSEREGGKEGNGCLCSTVKCPHASPLTKAILPNKHGDDSGWASPPAVKRDIMMPGKSSEGQEEVMKRDE